MASLTIGTGELIFSTRGGTLLLAVMTPVNLFAGVLSLALTCMLMLWMGRPSLPQKLRPSWLLTGLNALSGLRFLALVIKGRWGHENRVVAVGGLAALFVASLLVAVVQETKIASHSSSLSSGELTS